MYDNRILLCSFAIMDIVKNAVLIHGTGGSDSDYYWFASTQRFLEEHGYTVWWPLLPNTNNPDLEESSRFITDNMPAVDEETVIIAHSSACPLILHVLETLPVQVGQVVLVSGYYQPIANESGSMLPPKGFEWIKLKQKSHEFIFINSDNDPWGCTDAQARVAASVLNAPLIVHFGQGHMGSTSFDQPYREFPLLKRVLDV